MFGDKLREIRKSKNYTLEQLADEYNQRYQGGLNKGTLSRYENSKQQPMIYVVKNLASLLGVSADYLLEKDVPSTQTDTRASMEKEFEQIINQMDDSQLNRLEVALRILSAKQDDYDKLISLIELAMPGLL